LNFRFTIGTYFPDFEKKSERIKQSHDNLFHYLHKNTKTEKPNAKFFFNNIINALLQCLFLAEVKHEGRYYSKHTLFKQLKDNELKELRKMIALWSEKVHNTTESELNAEVNLEIEKYIKTTFANKFGFQNRLTSTNISTFLNKPSTDISNSSVNEKRYIYIYPDNTDIKIELGTVHSVKGETHTATLYLETYFNKKFEIERVKPNFDNTPLTNPNGEEKKAMKMLHVGFSRPTHLLCYAVCKTRYNNEINGFDKKEINT
jgi:DNA helicase-2/ATP-dependent DNA helicase PcrA